MKEMTSEQKAKAYDDALRKAKDMLSYKEIRQEDMEYLFPELKESENGDERIRKALIEGLREMKNNFHTISSINIDDCLDWLEKQGNTSNKVTYTQEVEVGNGNIKALVTEEIPIDKVEPKFHKGDWIIHQGTENIYQVVAIIDNQYQLKYGDNYTVQKCADVDSCARLWDITKDAKDGDVLCCESGWTCIFKTLVNDETFSSYCFMDKTKWFCEKGSECHTLIEEFVKAYNGNIHPATKEQRDQFEKAMTDAGYTFNFKKKKLEKIEQEPQRIISAEDKEALYDKSAWSEVDTFMYNRIKNLLTDISLALESRKSLFDWLESLKQRYAWKPNEGQMEAMENLIINIIRNPLLLDNYTQSNIRSLCNDLRKLVTIR